MQWTFLCNDLKDYVLSRVGKNQYTQTDKRILVDDGYSDCSSLMWAAYIKIGYDIGDYTGAQIESAKLTTVYTAGEYFPPESELLLGDLLFFKNPSSSYPHNVGHVEMYVGNGQLCGHGSGEGPTIKNMKSYCKERYQKDKGLICVRRLKQIHNEFNIESFYANILYRACTDSEVEAWLKQINLGMSLEEIRAGFVHSAENKRRIVKLYENILGRTAKNSEVTTWIDWEFAMKSYNVEYMIENSAEANRDA